MEGEPKPFVTGYPAAAQPSSAHGTAYPYPAHPYYAAPPPPAAPGLYGGPSVAAPGPYGRSNSSAAFLRRLIIIGISVLLLVGFATFILWLVLRPHLPEFAVTSASVSSFRLSASTQLSADFNLTLSVRNRNKKMGIFYDRVQAAVFYRQDPIAGTSLPPFYQGKGDSTVLPARLAAVAEYVDPDLTKDRAVAGAVDFDVKVMAWVRFRAGVWRTRRHVMRVFCGDVRIGFSNSTAVVGSLVGQPKRCQVDL
uniref:Uncharacterized protein At1g08160 n=1 Tax=Anthurium amnicola TaxID=1678845 RepID=A0A1D1ZK44_9ARAE